MSKYLLVTLVLLVAVALWRHKHRKTVAPKPRPGAALRNHLPVQTMVCCAHCGLHLPQAEASAANGQFFCSPASAARCPSAMKMAQATHPQSNTTLPWPAARRLWRAFSRGCFRP